MKPMIYRPTGGVVTVSTPAPGGGGNELPAGVFGSGSAGSVTYNSPTTLTADVEGTNVTINAAVTIGWNVAEGRPARIKATGTLHFGASGSIIANGTHTTNPTGGAAGAGGSAGGDGAASNPAPGIASLALDPSIGGKGADGIQGLNGTQPGGIAGVNNLVTLTALADIIAGQYGGQDLMGGSGGGGGGRDSVNGVPGGGGGGGGLIHVCAKDITEASLSANPRFSADGGRAVGNNWTNTGYGVGGGGGGGGIIVVCETIAASIGFSASYDSVVPTITPSQYPQRGHVYVASGFVGMSPYDLPVVGFYHPITVTW